MLSELMREDFSRLKLLERDPRDVCYQALIGDVTEQLGELPPLPWSIGLEYELIVLQPNLTRKSITDYFQPCLIHSPFRHRLNGRKSLTNNASTVEYPPTLTNDRSIKAQKMWAGVEISTNPLPLTARNMDGLTQALAMLTHIENAPTTFARNSTTSIHINCSAGAKTKHAKPIHFLAYFNATETLASQRRSRNRYCRNNDVPLSKMLIRMRFKKGTSAVERLNELDRVCEEHRTTKRMAVNFQHLDPVLNDNPKTYRIENRSTNGSQTGESLTREIIHTVKSLANSIYPDEGTAQMYLERLYDMAQAQSK